MLSNSQLGRFCISDEVLKNHQDEINQYLHGMLIVKTDHNDERHCENYTAIYSLFDIADPMKTTPGYILEANDSMGVYVRRVPDALVTEPIDFSFENL